MEGARRLLSEQRESRRVGETMSTSSLHAVGVMASVCCTRLHQEASRCVCTDVRRGSARGKSTCPPFADRPTAQRPPILDGLTWGTSAAIIPRVGSATRENSIDSAALPSLLSLPAQHVSSSLAASNVGPMTARSTGRRSFARVSDETTWPMSPIPLEGSTPHPLLTPTLAARRSRTSPAVLAPVGFQP